MNETADKRRWTQIKKKKITGYMFSLYLNIRVYLRSSAVALKLISFMQGDDAAG